MYGCGSGQNEWRGSKGRNLQVWNKCYGNIMDSMVTMVNNTLKLLRENLKTSHLKKQNSITMYGEKLWLFHAIYKYRITMVCTWNYFNVIFQLCLNKSVNVYPQKYVQKANYIFLLVVVIVIDWRKGEYLGVCFIFLMLSSFKYIIL